MTDEERGATDACRHKVTGDVHLVLVDHDGRVLLGRRHNTGFADGCYHLPAGHLEAGESLIEALIREAREETGIIISPGAIDFAHVMHNASGGGRVAFFFTVRRWSGVPGLQDAVNSVVSLPYCFPLRPLAGLGRRAPRGVEPGRQDRSEATGEQSIEFGGAEEVDQQATFGPGQVEDGEPIVGVVLDDFVIGPDVGSDRIDPQAE
jgi:8-oxo-dGTP pyrophosphatase MutT (NUDIX family)